MIDENTPPMWWKPVYRVIVDRLRKAKRRIQKRIAHHA